MAGAVGLRDDQLHLVPGTRERPQRRHGERRRAQEDDPREV
jgi:hypothetical protein